MVAIHAQPENPSAVGSVIDRSVCQRLLAAALEPDGWSLQSVSPGGVGPMQKAAFLAGKQGRQIAFFCADQDPSSTAAACRAIARSDRGRFERLAVLLVPRRADLHHLRQVNQARRYPRVLFCALEELQELADDRLVTASAPPGNIMAFRAKLLANDQVGGPDSPYYILRFQAPDLEDVTPSQFVMMDCAPQRLLLHPRRVRRGRWDDAVDLLPQPILKRPFGIQRAYHRHFDPQYLQRLNLPPSLALTLHPVYPHAFDLLYKVLEGGVGTSLMTRLNVQIHRSSRRKTIALTVNREGVVLIAAPEGDG